MTRTPEELVGAAITYWRKELEQRLELSILTPEEFEKKREKITKDMRALVDAERKGPEAAQRARERITTGRPFSPDSIPLSRPDIEKIVAKRKEDLHNFDQAVAASREALVSLTKNGADPVCIISVMIRYAWTRGTEVYPIHGVSFQPKDFDLIFPKGRNSLAEFEAAASGKPVTASLKARKIIGAPTARRKKTGPAEAWQSTGMAVLDDYLTIATTRPHHREIAELFSAWAFSHLENKHVARRIYRVLAHHEDFYKRRRHESRLRRALLYDFENTPYPN